MIHLKNLGIKKENKIDEELISNQQTNLSGKKIDETSLEKVIPKQVKSQLKNTDQIKTNPVKDFENQNSKSKIKITSFKDLISQANKEKEIELKFDLERNVKLVSFNKGKIDISFNEKLNKNFIKSLTEKLLQWTGDRWIISLSKNNEAKSIYEKTQENQKNEIEEFKKSKIAEDFENAFPDAKLLEISEEE
jgi:DNA polymerase-3 subunit gamma/tau